MAQKTILPIFQVFKNQSMTGTTVITQSVPSNVLHKDNITFQAQWTGNPMGTFAVQVSLDYNPGNPQNGGAPGGPANAGTWITLPCLDESANPPAASGAAGQIIFELNQISQPWVRLQYTN